MQNHIPTDTLKNEKVPKIYNGALHNKFSAGARASLHDAHLRVFAYKTFSSSVGRVGNVSRHGDGRLVDGRRFLPVESPSVRLRRRLFSTGRFTTRRPVDELYFNNMYQMGLRLRSV
jgi:hypothetical protein